MINKVKAFTLAEVLITLGVIGVVAALTIPNLVANYKVKVTVSKLKKTQSILVQAVMRATEDEKVGDWGLVGDDEDSSKLIAEKIKPYLNIADDCGNNDCTDYTTEFTFLNGQKDVNIYFGSHFFYKLRLSDGTEIFIRSGNSTIGFYTDINGKKAPNVLGKDIFPISVNSDNRLAALGIEKDPKTKGWEYCNPKSGQGWYCPAWVIYKENMDYLKCADELSWHEQSRCK